MNTRIKFSGKKIAAFGLMITFGTFQSTYASNSQQAPATNAAVYANLAAQTSALQGASFATAQDFRIII